MTLIIELFVALLIVMFITVYLLIELPKETLYEGEDD